MKWPWEERHPGRHRQLTAAPSTALMVAMITPPSVMKMNERRKPVPKNRRRIPSERQKLERHRREREQHGGADRRSGPERNSVPQITAPTPKMAAATQNPVV